MNLYILKYNNYYNRTIRKEDSLTGYLEYQLGNVIQGVAFNPGDGVATQQVVNLSEDQIGDYLLAVNEYNEIDSRWFILDCRRERTGQYTLTLRRDLIADNYSTIINAPCFIEKATLEDSDPMIYNSEDMTFNQIKTSETQLKDETGCPWIVGYVSSSQELDATIPSITGPINEIVAGIENYSYYNYTTTDFIPPLTKKIWNVYIGPPGKSWIWKYSFNENGMQETGYDGRYKGVSELETNNPECAGAQNQLTWTTSNVGRTAFGGFDIQRAFRDYYVSMDTALKATVDFQTSTAFTDFQNQNGKTIYDSVTQRFYRVEVQTKTEIDQLLEVKGNLFEIMKPVPNTIREISGPIGTWAGIVGTAGNKSFKVRVAYTPYRIRLVEIEGNTFNVKCPTTRYHLEDSPYDMFCIPYSDDLKIYKNGVLQFTSSKKLAFDTVMELARKYSGSTTKALYDLQLLPYCPVREYISDDGTFDFGNNQVCYITKSTGSEQSTNAGALYFSTKSTFSFKINEVIVIDNKKVQNLTDMWRLCSPNYNGVFEFNAAKNDGVEYLDIDCTYKPYNPYIHVNPNFKNLYGQDFDDSRGLICGGDFSLPQTTSAWESYQLSNKNYQQIFDRQIENMEVNNSVQRERQKWQIASGAVGAGMGGALTGALVGGPIGAVVGGLVGAGASAAAGIRDYQLSEQLRQEAIDYNVDQFGYQLGNIKALPTGLSKSSAFTANNKIYPFIEYYTCTEEEKIALKNKIKYNGMTVMRIGSVGEFLREQPSYIKGKLIRLEGTDNNFHVVNEIANEINKGVFI